MAAMECISTQWRGQQPAKIRQAVDHDIFNDESIKVDT